MTAAPGWYPDTVDPRCLRWWDGTVWTEHVGPPASQQLGRRPPISPETPVYNPFIWIIAGMPLLPVILMLAWNPKFRFVTTRAGDPVPDPASIFDAGYFLLLGALAFVYLGSVALAFFDYRSLRGKGVVRPFHWAWAFMYMGGLVYVIGRAVVVNKVASGRGWWPVGLLVAGWLTYIVVGSAKSMQWVQSFNSGMGYGS